MRLISFPKLTAMLDLPINIDVLLLLVVLQATCFAVTFTSWLYCAVKLHRHIKKEYFVKRGPSLLIAYFYLSGININVTLPVGAMIATDFIFEDLDKKVIIIHGLIIISEFLAQSTAILLVLRLVLQFMQIRRSEDAVKWKKQIDPQYTSFALRYFAILGNQKKLFKIYQVIILSQLIVLLFLLMFLGFPFATDSEYQFESLVLSTMFLAVIHIIVLTIAIYCGFRVRKFLDYWQIRNEFKKLMFLIVGTTILIIIFAGIVYYFELPILVLMVALLAVFIIFTIGTWYINVIWVIKVNKGKLDKNDDPNAAQNMTITLRDVVTDSKGMFICVATHFVVVTISTF